MLALLIVIALLLTGLGVVGMAFASVTRWKSIEARSAGAPALERRVQRLEAELAELRELVHDTIITASDHDRLRQTGADEPPRKVSA